MTANVVPSPLPREANSAPANFLAGFQGLPCSGQKRRKKEGREGKGQEKNTPK